jgi:hypothetical protein
MARTPEIDFNNSRLTALGEPNGPQRAKIPEADCTSPLPERCEITRMVSRRRIYYYSGLPHSIIFELVSGRGICHMTW